ncbi:hypothetical protein QAD02_004922 [Eretmocerus hayati]|uniref:Uncharacterized protein n=1 Tax=Eretmocerus hayati TaxID=131215 RepID=A0ACC2NQW3_9HYME|nr:hypothetical protein QAD02_004922 [Eretmocerus hayati]
MSVPELANTQAAAGKPFVKIRRYRTEFNSAKDRMQRMHATQELRIATELYPKTFSPLTLAESNREYDYYAEHRDAFKCPQNLREYDLVKGLLFCGPDEPVLPMDLADIHSKLRVRARIPFNNDRGGSVVLAIDIATHTISKFTPALENNSRSYFQMVVNPNGLQLVLEDNDVACGGFKRFKFTLSPE